MIRRLTFRREAEVDIAGTYDWYAEKESGLGTAFLEEVAERRAIGLYRRNLQRYYLDRLIDISKKPTGSTDVDAVVRNKLDELTQYLKKALPKAADDPMTQYHLRYMIDRLEKR